MGKGKPARAFAAERPLEHRLHGQCEPGQEFLVAKRLARVVDGDCLAAAVNGYGLRFGIDNPNSMAAGVEPVLHFGVDLARPIAGQGTFDGQIEQRAGKERCAEIRRDALLLDECRVRRWHHVGILIDLIPVSAAVTMPKPCCSTKAPSLMAIRLAIRP